MVTVALLGTLTSACTMSVPEFKVRATSSYATTTEKDGLLLAVHPTVDPREMDDTFKLNLVEKQLLPVLVVAENRSPSTSFILAVENVKAVERGKGQTAEGSQGPVTSETAGQAMAAAGVFAPLLPILLPLLIAGVKAISDAQVMQHNVADKAFYSRTLDPGQRAFGYVYVSLPKETKAAGPYELTVRALSAADGRDITLTLPIEYQPR